MKNLFLLAALGLCVQGSAQLKNGNGGGNSASNYTSFIDYQKTLPRPSDAMRRKEDTLQRQFRSKGLVWPAKYVYIRSFKYDSQLEIWVKDEWNDPFKLFKTYKVCALAGTMGPKRVEGDYQVPEGFYYINEFNAKSAYHLSLGLNYPNLSDRILSDALRPGGEIYIHGSCVTVGCIPLTDQLIEEVYIITAYAKNLGQDFIPVHIFPIRFNVKKSIDYLEKLTLDDPKLKEFTSNLEDAFNYFEKHKQIPVILISEKGEYTVNDAPSKIKVADPLPVKRQPVQHRIRKITDLADVVLKWPEYPGGGPAFLSYLDKLGKDMAVFLPEKVKKVYIKVEFIIDRDGTPVNFKIINGVNEDFDDDLITELEKTMPNWKPAIVNDKPVPKKMIQTIFVHSGESE